MRILVVDDEKLLVKGIKFNLEHDGYQVEGSNDGDEAIELARTGRYDLLIMDWMMPTIDGLEACKRIREFSSVPIIMLTAKSDDNEKLIGFEYGADDYMTKPFNVMELKARVRAILRRSSPALAEAVRVKIDDLELDSAERVAILDGKKIELTAREFDLMELLMKYRGRVYTRENLLNTVWGYEYPGDIRTVDVHVRRLREKLERNPAEPEILLTKWGVGYYCKA